MPLTSAPAGVAVGTALTTIYTNPSNSGEFQTIEIQIVNNDGTNDADLTACNFVDASPAGSHPILPTNYTVKAKTGAVSFRKVLEPGDSIRMSASAAGDLYATAEKIFSEPST